MARYPQKSPMEIRQDILERLKGRQLQRTALFKQIEGAGWERFNRIVESMEGQDIEIVEVAGETWVQKAKEKD